MLSSALALGAAAWAAVAPQMSCEDIVARVLSASVQTAVAAPPHLDEYIRCEMRQRQIPGLALAITHNGELVAERSYGLASIQNDAPVTAKTRFEIASITKPFTAVGIMMLVQDGRLELDAPVTRYLADAPAAWRTITVRHLLNHTSGVPPMGHAWTERHKQSPETLVRLLGPDRSTEQEYKLALQDKLWFAAGAGWAYSDVGYFLLGVITERASGMPWRTFIEQRIFLPLGMTDSYVLDLWSVHKDEARPYTIRNGSVANMRRNLQVETPSYVGIFSNVGDLAKFDAALMTNRLLTEESRRVMWTPTRLANGETFPYSLGWEVWNSRGHAAQYHGGYTGTEFLRLPDDQLAVIVLTNLGAATRLGIAQNVAKMLVPGLKRPALRDVAISEPDLRPYTGRYSSIEGDVFEVTIENGQLSAPYPWPFPRKGGRAVLKYQGNHVFEFVDHDGRITFLITGDTASGLRAVAWDGGLRYDLRRQN